MTPRKLGKQQQGVLAALRQHGEWWQTPNACSGWVWDTRANTRNILESLVRRGYVTKTTNDGLGLMFKPVKE